MLSVEVIQAFINDVNEKQNSVIYQTSMANAQWLKETLIEVLQYIEELNKGQHSLMQSRKKWKSRYYKSEKVDWKRLYNECSNAIKKAGLTKEDTDKIIKETRQIQWKAKKYDELIEKLEEVENRNAKLYRLRRQKEVDFGEWELASELLAILKGEKEVCN